MREGNACFGLCIGVVLSIPIYGATAWIVARIFRIDYGLALLLVLAVGTVAVGGLVAYIAAKRAPKSEEAIELPSAIVTR